jgi:uncharacterized protein (DUF952 family)
MTRMIYHGCPAEAWAAAVAAGRYDGTVDDRRDGFIHFLAAEQLPESARRHRAGQVLVVGNVARLRWEPSRRGALFPHLCGALLPDEAAEVVALPLGLNGEHIFPPLV